VSGDRVVTRGPDRAECKVTLAAPERVRRLETAAGGEERRFPRRGRRAGVRVEPAAAGGAESLEVIEIRRGVHPLEIGPCRPARNEALAGVAGRAGVEPGEDGPHAFRAFGMAAAGVVFLEMGIGRDEQHDREGNDPPPRNARRPLPSLRSPPVKAHRAQSYRFRGGVARVAAWHGRADVASLALHGADAPSPRTLHRLLERLHAAGYREVVTNALGPGASLPLVDVGFAVRGRLHLLVHDLEHLPKETGLTRRTTRSDRGALLAADAAAFDEFWRFDALALREAARATPRSHIRVAPTHQGPFGYGLFGRAATAGYVQRLAVAPDVQRRGFGRALLTDGLRWLRSHGARRVYVNTQEDNDRALALYLASGFSQLPVGLHVLGREL
jgi:ribosomal protein S18 acetylase RimI-like enzyme